ncbi:hypothetical protein BZA77DRAFT_297124 [Pyronema omphalodes]|nr:hypothetical protein BZA77DRAFT_297124 [Pyronema omphalodes]
MSSVFDEFAQKIDELREQELELEARGMEQQKQVEKEIEVLEEREAQQVQLKGEGVVETLVVLTSLQQSLQRVDGSGFSQVPLPELSQGPNHPPSPSGLDGRSSNTEARSRAYLSDDDKVILMDLCVDYQSEHVSHKKTDFCGKVVGTVQRENELSQKIDQWILHEDEMKEATAQDARTPAAQDRGREEPAVQRRFLLARWGMNWSREETDWEQSEAQGDFSTLNGELAVVTTQKKHTQPRPREEMQGKFQELRTEIERDGEAAQHDRALMETQRSENLARAEKQRAEDLSSHREEMEMQLREDHLRMETERAEDKAAHDARMMTSLPVCLESWKN